MKRTVISPRHTDRTGTINAYFADINRFPMLGLDEETTVAIRARRGSHPDIQRLVNANLRFVVSVAKQFHYPGTDLSDLIQAGNEGLMVAANRFDPSRGFRFISYAVHYIRRDIIAFVNRNKLIRLPDNVIKHINRLKVEADAVCKESGHNMHALDVLTDEGVDKWEQLSPHMSEPLSLNAPINEEGEERIATIPALDRDEPNTELVRHVCQQLLSDADYQLIARVLGIGCQPVLIRIIAKEMGITHQATLNRYRAALCRLRQRLENRPNLMKELFEN